MPDWFLGVDGGQSGMRALIADEAGRVIGSGSVTGPASPTDGAQGGDRFEEALQLSIATARDRAGIPIDTQYRAACFGFSGGPTDKDALARATVSAETYFITHDAWIALTGATGGGPGIVTIAGTGSIAFGRNSRGATARAGGWGFAFGDEGGGFDLARQAIRVALRQEEGWGPPTALRAALLEATGSRDANHLLHRFYWNEIPRSGFAALAEVVDRVARQGDPLAQQLLHTAAQELATLASAVRRQLFRDADQVDVRYSGGVFRSPAILSRFQMLVEMDGRASVSAPLYTPAGGALLEAFRIAGAACTLKES